MIFSKFWEGMSNPDSSELALFSLTSKSNPVQKLSANWSRFLVLIVLLGTQQFSFGQTVTVNADVVAAADDALEFVGDGTMQVFNAWLDFPYDFEPPNGLTSIGLRFRSLDIPQNADVVNAYIEFTAGSTGDPVSAFIISGHDTDNAFSFSTSPFNISSRTRTLAFIPWTLFGVPTGNGTRFATPDISTIVEEIVARPGWSNNNDMVFVIDGSVGFIDAYSFDNGFGQPASLVVEYIVIPTCDNVTNAGSIGGAQTACGPFYNPTTLTNTSSPSGGSGLLEYTWESSPTPDVLTSGTTIAGANSSTYDPGTLSETTYFIRYSRRDGCSTYLPSNVVSVSVLDGCDPFCDVLAPVLLGVPADVSVDCGAIPAAASVTASDNCDPSVTVNFNEVIGAGCPYAITRTWTAADVAGNTDSATQTILVSDSSSPLFSGLPSAAISVDCDAIPGPAAVTATDNCDPLPSVSFNETNTAGCPYTITRTWVTQDNCANSDTFIQTITVTDNADPVITGIPADLTIDCLDGIPGAAVGSVTDNCDPAPSLTFEEVTSVDCPTTVTRTWTSQDNCGNQSTAVQVITVIDTVAPVLSGVPANTTVLCGAVPAPASVTAFDACDTVVSVGYNESISSGVCPVVITRTWVAADNCGNATVVTQEITTIDNTAPVLSGVPSDTTIGCGEILPTTPTVTTLDDCDIAPSLFYNETTPTAGTVLRTWTTIDVCGNLDLQTQTISIVGTTAPPVLVGVPADTTVDCTVSPALPTVTAADEFGNPLTVTFTETVGSGCPYDITRTWFAADICGLITSDVQTITVVDTESPVIIGVPADTMITCEDPIPGVPAVSVTDNCATPALSFSTSTFGFDSIGDCDYTIVRIWTAIDSCGNSALKSYLIDVNPVPSTNPVALDDDLSTIEDIPASIDLLANDFDPDNDLDPSTVVLLSSLPAVQGVLVNNGDGTVTFNPAANYDGAVSTVAYAVSDSTGQSDTADILISITPQNDLPSLLADSEEICYQSTVTVDVIANDSDIDGFIVPSSLNIVSAPLAGTATANVDGSITYTHTGTSFAGDVLTYSVSDNDGGGSTTTLSMTIAVPPVITGVPVSGATVDCGSVPAPATGITATDFNGNALTVSFEEIRDPGCPATLSRIWSATDSCGVSSTDTQTLFIDDSNPPVLIAVPINQTVTCDMIPAAASVTADDDCDPAPSVSFNEILIGYSGVGDCDYTIERTWTGADACSNSVSETQIITVIPVPTTGPVAANDLLNTLEDVANTLDLSANDFDPDGDLVPSSVFLLGGIPTGQGNLVNNGDGSVTFTPASNYDGAVNTVSYSIADALGQTDTADLFISITPQNDLPVALNDNDGICYLSSTNVNVIANDSDIDGSIDPTTLTLLTAPMYGTATANPDGTIDYTHSGPLFATDVFNYSIVDNDGGVASASVTINIAAPPTITGMPASGGTVDCGAVPPPATSVVATDFTGANLTLTFSETRDPGCPATISRVWSATDLCGVNIAETQIFFVDDNTAPVLTGVPANETVFCDAIPAAATVTISDDCDPSPILNFNEVLIDFDSIGDCAYTISRSWTGEDACNNSFVGSQLINVIPTTVFNSFPIALDDAASLCFGATVTVDVVANDSDIDGFIVPSSLAIGVVPSGGTATANTDGTITFVHDGSSIGPVTVIYTIADNEGAATSGNLIIQTNPPVSLTGQTSNANCNAADGSIDVTRSGGTGPFSYLWSTGATTQDLLGIAGGTYSVTVTDNLGCTFSDSYTVMENGGIQLEGITTTPASTCTSSDGSVLIDLKDEEAGVPPYSLTINGIFSFGPFSSEPILLFGARGGAKVNKVEVVDANGCIVIDNNDYPVGQPDLPQIQSITPIDPSCTPDSMGSLVVNLLNSSAGIPSYYAKIGTFIYGPFGAEPFTIPNLPPGNYIKPKIRDGNGCVTKDNGTYTIQDCSGLRAATLESFEDPATGIEPMLSRQIWPNPTAGPYTLELALSMPQDVQIEIRNVQGQLIEILNYSAITFLQEDLSAAALGAGMYTIKWTIGEKWVYYDKLIKHD